jgi:hypothetical protein
MAANILSLSRSPLFCILFRIAVPHVTEVFRFPAQASQWLRYGQGKPELVNSATRQHIFSARSRRMGIIAAPGAPWNVTPPSRRFVPPDCKRNTRFEEDSR